MRIPSNVTFQNLPAGTSPNIIENHISVLCFAPAAIPLEKFGKQARSFRWTQHRRCPRCLDVRDHFATTQPQHCLAAHCPDDWRFTGTCRQCHPAAAFIPMPVFGQTADESFVDLDYSAEFSNGFHQGDANTMAHVPSGLQRTKAHIAPNLPSAYSLLAG
jgi:hypothetical protein